ncbi:short-chain dehydrogenase [Amycolatopsis sp. AA4]|uniref:SDR family NAD(P)-dependent oxidoreductase n=1 Tax=Actinomycetes TaxID=1760 RepID=UPI0001B545B5|nr:MULTISPECIES: SDR family NAD(P)-dependent oxidoreductase [Actinomycetes]ATY13008.1 short-chain dehydrogenase [Amycolatopsis sp. AA4]EFL08878.1 2-hydroxycyclohexanecarboxyl-CoA dehydrogenase [Streptomyces sp. AA4]
MCAAISRRVLVTGAGSGFGLGVTRLLEQRGHRVVAGVLNEVQADNLRSEFSSASSRVEIRKLDLTDPADVASAGELEIDVLVNNAGFGAQGPISESPLELVRHVFEVNVFGTLDLTQRVLARFHRDSRPGRVVVVSSVAGLLVSEGAGAYSMSKHALDAMAVEMQNETEGTPVSVHIVNPGPYATGFNERLVENAPQATVWAADQDHRGLLEGQHDPRELIEALADLADGSDSSPRLILPREFVAITGQFQFAQIHGA